jgi:hypothetical protein
MTFITVYRAYNQTEANMVRDFLNDQNIRATILSQLPAAVYGLAMQALEVQVEERDEARALEWIEAYFSANVEISQESSDLPSDD